MSTDTIQIGPLIISTAAFTVIASLFGTVLGGLITYFTIHFTEKQKWKQQRQDKHDEEQAAAIEIAMEWIGPIKIALATANRLVRQYLHRTISSEDFRKRWPKLNRSIKLGGNPAKFDIYLDSINCYNRVAEIEHGIQDVEMWATFGDWAEGAPDEEEQNAKLKLCLDQIESINKNLESLEKDLITTYKRKFS